MNTWRKIELQLKSNLESNWIWTLRFLHSIIHLAQKLKLDETHDTKLRIQLKSNWMRERERERGFSLVKTRNI